MSVRRAWVGPSVALLLAVAIAAFGRDVFARVMVLVQLHKAGQQLDAHPARVLANFSRDAWITDASPGQRRRIEEMGRDAIALAAGGASILRQVGWRRFDPARASQEYVTSSNEMTLLFDVPPSLRFLRPELRVTSAGIPVCQVTTSEDGAEARADVPLRDDESLVVDVDVGVELGGGILASARVVRGLRLLRSTRGPAFKLLVGDRAIDLPDRGVASVKVDRGMPLRLEAVDDRGLAELQWSVEGVAHEPIAWPEAAFEQRHVASLPAELTARAANPRRVEIRASNAHRLETRAAVDLRVRDPGVPIVAAARVDGAELLDGAMLHISDKSVKLSIEVSVGEDPQELEVVWDDRAVRTHVDDRHVAAVLDSEVEGVRALAVSAAGAPVLRARVRFDWTAPVITATLDPGRFARDLEVRRPVHEVPVGAVVAATVVDEAGLDPASLECDVAGAALELLDEPAPDGPGGESLRSWTRRVRCYQAGQGHIRVIGADRAGNRTTIHEFRIQAADPMADRAVTVNGWPFPGNRPVPLPEPRLVIVSEGGIDLDGLAFVILDPARGNEVVGRGSLGRTERARTRTATIELSRMGRSGATLLGVLARNEEPLAKGPLVVDYSGPRFAVKGLDQAGGGGDEPRYFASPGERVSVVIEDDVGVDASTISVLQGATIDSIAGANEISVVLLLQEVFEEAVVLRASDVAGNVAELRFEAVARDAAVSRESETRPAAVQKRPDPSRPQVSPDGGPPPPSPRATLADLQGAPRITHAALGTFLLVGTEAAGGPFYLAEHELLVKDWRTFVAQGRAMDGGVGRNDAIMKAAASLLNYNTERLRNGEDEPLAGTTVELVKAYVRWANAIAPDYGSWRVPTVAQWQLAAGRALHPDAAYPTTAAHPSGSDLTNLGVGGALFGRAFLTAREMPKQPLQAGAFGLKGMPGSLYEWVIDGVGAQARLRLVGGSAFSPKEACRIDALPKSQQGVEEYERGLRIALVPRAR